MMIRRTTGRLATIYTGLLAVLAISACTWNAAATQAADAPGKPINPAFIPAEASFVIVAHPRLVFALPSAEMLPVEVLTAAGQKELGFDPATIDELVAFGTLPDKNGQPTVGAVLRFADAPVVAEVKAKFLKGAKETTRADGKTVFQVAGPNAPVVFLADAKTMVIGSAGFFDRMLAVKEPPAKVIEILKQFDSNTHLAFLASYDTMHDQLNDMLRGVPGLPGPVDDIKKLPNLLSWSKLNIKAGDRLQIVLTSQAHDAKSSEEAERILKSSLAFGQQMAIGAMAQNAGRNNDPVEQAAMRYAKRMIERFFKDITPTRDGTQVSLSLNAYGDMMSVSMMAGLMMPAISSAREAARRAQVSNELRQFTIAMLNYESMHRELPARAICDKAGKPLLSWRVQLLPMLDEDALFKEFHLDEPWDSEHNKPLIAKMPRIFRNPNRDPSEFTTNFLAPVGKGTIFEGTKGMKMDAIKDGLSNTIMLVEADDDKAVVWTKPDDLEIDLARPLDGLGNLRPGGFNAAFADGHVSFISTALDLKTLAALFTAAGGEVVGPQ